MHFFARNYGMYDVYKLHSATKNLTSVNVKIKDLYHMLTINCWDGVDDNELNYYEFNPLDLIKHKISNLEHFERVMNADLNYPLLIVDPSIVPKEEYYNEISHFNTINTKFQLDVVDGLHRLTKAYIMGLEVINVVYVPWNILKTTKITNLYGYYALITSNSISRNSTGSYIINFSK